MSRQVHIILKKMKIGIIIAHHVIAFAIWTAHVQRLAIFVDCVAYFRMFLVAITSVYSQVLTVLCKLGSAFLLSRTSLKYLQAGSCRKRWLLSCHRPYDQSEDNR